MSNKSLYSKIYFVLETSNSNKIGSEKELIDILISRNSPIFLTLQYDSDSDTTIYKLSVNSIKKTVKFSIEIGFLNSDGVLTDNGKIALKPKMFNVILTQLVLKQLELYDIHIEVINSIITTDFHSFPPNMPTAQRIWDKLESKVSYTKFTKYLTLLSSSGFAISSQSKVYLTFIELPQKH